ncbi:hypothetical protein Zm00014a_018022 [Zea mays]|uniref:Uncharacterized protein n=1 Tax=Zea mays TaxID=4577 RepID=A0A3L6FIN5_MAIZE|nr:hypothetical protein Zm00014a_018022 [Zea mays]
MGITSAREYQMLWRHFAYQPYLSLFPPQPSSPRLPPPHPLLLRPPASTRVCTSPPSVASSCNQLSRIQDVRHHIGGEYINMKTQKISKLLSKRFTTPVWIKHKEPREVNMFVDLLLLEFHASLGIGVYFQKHEFF